MFPHTPHMELVMVFERIEYEAEEPMPSVAGHYQPSAADSTPAAAPAAAPGVVDAATSTSNGTAALAPQATVTWTETTPAPASVVAATAAGAGVPMEAARVEALAREETGDHPLMSNPLATAPAAPGAAGDTVA